MKDNEWTWARRFFSEEEIEDFTIKSEKIIYDAEHGLVVNIGLSNDMCIELVENWGRAHHDDLQSQIYMLHFIDGFIDYLKDYLESEEIPFDDYE